MLAISFAFTAGSPVGWGDVDITKPHFVSMVLDGADSAFYVDGALDTVGVDPGDNPLSGITIGASHTGANFSNIAVSYLSPVAGAMSGYDVARAWETYIQPRWVL